MKGKKTAMNVPEMSRSVHFSFGEKAHVPKGFADLQIGKEITLIVKGKVAGLTQDEYGSGMRIESYAVSIERGSDEAK